MTAELVRQAGADDNRQHRHPLRRWLERFRLTIDRYPRIRFAYRLIVALVGSLIVLAGAILIPLPGPGWLIVFLGVAVLGTEFAAARRFNAMLRRMLARATAWWKARRAARSASRARA